MSCEALSYVWQTSGVSAEEKLMLLWIANNSGALGHAVMVEPHGMGEFIGGDPERAMTVLEALSAKGLVRWGTEEEETSSYLWLAYDGPYEPPIDWLGETKNRNRRVSALLERDGPGCTYCSRTPINYHVDHFIPKSKGGADRMHNLVLACADCNLAKRDKDPEVFLSDRPELFRIISTNLKCLHE